ncbi:hypothetical protein [Vibrio mediterranei]|uniref:hypothetical protein n=1 Tax=Vibrio mediterranei TaxID=689 RepID=UPI004067B9EC
MTVIFYGDGEHPAGFVGYRAVSTLGRRYQFRQRYFSLKEYSTSTAQRLANDFDSETRRLAEEHKKKKKINLEAHEVSSTAIKPGLYTQIVIERWQSAGEIRYLYYPQFVVSALKGVCGAKVSRFGGKRNYVEAYRKAVEMFCDSRGYDYDVELELKAELPDREIFRIHYERLKEKGYDIEWESVRAKLYDR